MSVYHHYTHIVNAFCSVEGATTPTLKMRRLSYPLSVLLFGPLAFFFGPLPGGQVHLILDLPPSAWALVPRHGQKGFIGHPGGGSSLRLVDTSGAPWVLPFPCYVERIFSSQSAWQAQYIVWIAFSVAKHFFCISWIKDSGCLEPRSSNQQLVSHVMISFCQRAHLPSRSPLSWGLPCCG